MQCIRTYWWKRAPGAISAEPHTGGAGPAGAPAPRRDPALANVSSLARLSGRMVGRFGWLLLALMIVPIADAGPGGPELRVSWLAAQTEPTVEAPPDWDCSVTTGHGGGYSDVAWATCTVPPFHCSELTAAMGAVATAPSSWIALAMCGGPASFTAVLCSDSLPYGPLGLGIPRQLSCQRSVDVDLEADTVACALSMTTRYGPYEDAGEALDGAGVQFLPGTGSATCTF